MILKGNVSSKNNAKSPNVIFGLLFRMVIEKRVDDLVVNES
jgi:hypothetical protein